MSKPRLGELLVSGGLITEAALAEVLEVQKVERRRLGDLLAERGLVQPRQLAQILSYQLSCAWVSLTNMEIPRGLIDLFPRELALKHTVVPVHLRETEKGTVLHLAMHDPTDDAALNECATAMGIVVRPMIALTFEIRQALARFYGAPAPSLRVMEAVRPPASSRRPEPLAASAAPASSRLPLPHAPALTLTSPKNITMISARRSEAPESTRRRPSLPPVVLVVNAPENFRDQCERATLAVGGVVHEVTLLDAAEQVTTHRPIAIVVTDDIYAFDRSGLNRLAIEVDALLVVWSEDVDAKQLEPLLDGAVKRWRRTLS